MISAVGIAVLIGVLLASVTTGYARPSGQAADLRATFASGQTFLTWEEVPGADISYSVYRRVGGPIVDVSEGVLISEVRSGSSLNRRASQAQNDTLYYRIPPSRDLTASRGLLVWTALAEEEAYYAVTARDQTGENRTLTPGENALASPVSERVEWPEPVWQETLGGEIEGERYAHWVNWEDTPLIPAMANRPGLAYNFVLQNVKETADQSLLVRLHGGGGNYTRTNFGTSNPDELRLSLDDPFPDFDTSSPDAYSGRLINTAWFGYNSNYLTGKPLTEGLNHDYTRRRMVAVIEWIKRAFNVDPNRVYMAGSSFGGVGAASLGFAHPDLFAALYMRVPRFDFGEYPEWDQERSVRSPDITRRFYPAWGTLKQNLPTSSIGDRYPAYRSVGDGLGVYDRTDQITIARRFPAVDFPVLIIGCGKKDPVVGWHEKPHFIETMRASRRQMFFYWTDEGHGAMGGSQDHPWRSAFDIDRLNRYVRNRSYPAVTHLSIDDDPGQGGDILTPPVVTGEPVGTVNGYVDWEPSSIVDREDEWGVTLHLLDLVDAFPDTRGLMEATVDVTPRRLQNFRVQPGRRYLWKVLDAATKEDLMPEAVATADSYGLVTFEGVRIRRT